MLKIAPSILAADFLHLADDVEIVNKYADIFHLDIMDGTFVPNISFGFPVVEAISKVAEKPMDVHLMIVEPWKYVERFASIGVSMLSFHYEAALDKTNETLSLIRSFGMKAGLVINPDVPVETLFPYLGEVDYVLLMSVFAGFGGQKFIESTYGRIARLKERIESEGLDIPIEVDGGVSPANAGALEEVGAGILVAGSSVFRAEDPEAAIKAMRQR
ncbi:MAG: ribulose-phosphate 3-epimerase, partial [Bacteroidales bacterium]|nr:ribulose-phosphate 3-epimerase [Bacteroidales bacterium]